MRIATLGIALALLPLAARAQEADRPVTDRTVTAADVAATPVTDLNLRKPDIPPVLLAAQARPYDLSGVRRCSEVIAAVEELDAALGDDIDVAPDEKRGPSAGKLAQWLVGSFIPFRGAIREISGANEQQRRVRMAIEAGIARRSYLKGFGEARGCRYPGRAATEAEIAALGGPPAPSGEKKAKRRKEEGQGHASRPVVQPVP